MSYTIKTVSGNEYTSATELSNGNWQGTDGKGQTVEVTGSLVESKKEDDDDSGRILLPLILIAAGLSPC